jgi:hypothetical protein
MDVNLIIAIISAIGIPTIISSLVLAKLSKMDKKEEARQAIRLQGDMLEYQQAEDTGHLAKVTALLVQDCRCNDDPNQLANAIHNYDETHTKLKQFMIEQTARSNQYPP